MEEIIYVADDPHPVSFDSHVSLETWETILALKWDKKKLLHRSLIVQLFHDIFIKQNC